MGKKDVAVEEVIPAVIKDPRIVLRMLTEFRNFNTQAALAARETFRPVPQKPTGFRLSPAGYATYSEWHRQVSASLSQKDMPQKVAGLPVIEDNSLVGDAVVVEG